MGVVPLIIYLHRGDVSTLMFRYAATGPVNKEVSTRKFLLTELRSAATKPRGLAAEAWADAALDGAGAASA